MIPLTCIQILASVSFLKIPFGGEKRKHHIISYANQNRIFAQSHIIMTVAWHLHVFFFLFITVGTTERRLVGYVVVAVC